MQRFLGNVSSAMKILIHLEVSPACSVELGKEHGTGFCSIAVRNVPENKGRHIGLD